MNSEVINFPGKIFRGETMETKSRWIKTVNDCLHTESYISGQGCIGYVYTINPRHWIAVTIFENGQELDSFHATKKSAKTQIENYSTNYEVINGK